MKNEEIETYEKSYSGEYEQNTRQEHSDIAGVEWFGRHRTKDKGRCA